jgi:hypothetical protein
VVVVDGAEVKRAKTRGKREEKEEEEEPSEAQ